MDADELAVLAVALCEAEGRPYRIVIRGDGKTFVSVETVLVKEGPAAGVA